MIRIRRGEEVLLLIFKPLASAYFFYNLIQKEEEEGKKEKVNSSRCACVQAAASCCCCKRERDEARARESLCPMQCMYVCRVVCTYIQSLVGAANSLTSFCSSCFKLLIWLGLPDTKHIILVGKREREREK